MRIFIALQLQTWLQNRLVEAASALAESFPSGSVRWVRPDGHHLTLKFLGGIGHYQAEEITALLQTTCGQHEPFEMEVRGMGCFPGPRRPRVLWVGVREPSKNLVSLAGAIDEACGQIGFARERRAFSPHITLGRVKKPLGEHARRSLEEALRRSKGEIFGRQAVSAISLMKSTLTAHGARYEEMGKFKLGART